MINSRYFRREDSGVQLAFSSQFGERRNTAMQMPEIDVVDIVQTVRRQYRIFFSVIAALMVMTALGLHVAPTQYTESISVAPVSDSNSPTGGSLSALAKLGGINLNDKLGQGQFQLFVSALTTRDTANTLASNTHLMRRLFARQWSESNQRWEQPFSPLRGPVRALKSILGIPVEPWHPPSGENIYQMLVDDLQVDNDPKNPTITLAIQSENPEIAREFLTDLVNVVDLTLRRRALDRANDYIAYLIKELDRVTVSDYRAALVDRLSQQEQIRMMASASVAFSGQVFSGPSRSVTATAPKSVLILFLALFAGIFAGIVAAKRADQLQLQRAKFTPSRQPKPDATPAGQVSPRRS